jgi:hypothetical protein
MDLELRGWGSVKFILVAQGRGELWAAVNTVMNLRAP